MEKRPKGTKKVYYKDFFGISSIIHPPNRPPDNRCNSKKIAVIFPSADRSFYLSAVKPHKPKTQTLPRAATVRTTMAQLLGSVFKFSPIQSQYTTTIRYCVVTVVQQ